MSATRREIEDTRLLLKDLARRHMQVERAKEGWRLSPAYYYCLTFNFTIGLVISEAFYGPSDAGDEAKDLMVDVTIAVQALVHNSQVYISGHRSKVN